jgi:hypothetical protein
MHRPFLLLALAAVVLLQGCTRNLVTDDLASNAPGQAVYTLTKSPDGACKVMIISGRDVESGSVSIREDCTVEAEAQALSGVEMQRMNMMLTQQLLQILSRSPAP